MIRLSVEMEESGDLSCERGQCTLLRDRFLFFQLFLDVTQDGYRRTEEEIVLELEDV